MYTDQELLKSVTLVAAHLETLIRTLLTKGVISQEELDRHYPKTEQERKEFARMYFPDLFEAMFSKEGKPTD